MLLQKHGGQDDAGHQHTGADLHPFVLAELLAAGDRQMNADGVVHMDARKQVRGGIRGIQALHQVGEDIVILKHAWPQIMTVGVDGGNHQEHSHPHKQEAA